MLPVACLQFFQNFADMIFHRVLTQTQNFAYLPAGFATAQPAQHVCFPPRSWDCKYHRVFIPKKRQKLIYGAIRKDLGEILHDLAKRRGVIIEEGHLTPDHIHMRISIPPKYAVSNVVGYLKEKAQYPLHESSKVD